jgi:flagellin
MATPLAINTNVGSLTAQRNLQKIGRGLQQSISRLSSGTRINSAADNAAGMAVSENMRAQLKGFQQAMKNANDGVAVLQTAESGYQSISDLLIRMRELAVQSANDSVSDTERGYLDTEFTDLISEINRISNVVEYNGIQLLDGTSGSSGDGTMIFQVGTRDSANDRITIKLQTQNATALSVDTDRISSQIDAQSAITAIDSALELLSTDRAQIGSTINTLNVAVDGLGSSIENYGNALSQIKDTDMAEESSMFSKNNVLQQAAVAMLSQANQTPNLVMRLLG